MTKRDHASWRETIDGWVRDPAIRRHSLIALAMILVATTIIVSLATGALIAAAGSLLPSPVAKTVAVVSALGTSGTGWWLFRGPALGYSRQSSSRKRSGFFTSGNNRAGGS
jgi:hypothetical protein